MQERERRRTLTLALVLVTLLSFSPVARNGFVRLDDAYLITENPVVQRGLTLDGVAWALTSTESANWFPVPRLGYLLDVELFGSWAGGHHLAQLGVHAAAAAALFSALALMTGALAPSLLVAAVFAVHPLRVESVAWAAELSDTFAALFFGLALHRNALLARSRRPRDRFLLAAFVALGCASKPTFIVVPPILLLLDFWPLGRLRLGPVALLREKTPLLALAGATAVLTLVTQQGSGAVASLEEFPPAVRLMNAALSTVTYLGKIVWPLRLSPFYPHPGAAVPAPEALLAAAAIAAAAAYATARRRTSPWLLAGGGWYLVALLPVLGLVQAGEQAMADRFTNLAATGAVIAATWEARRRFGGSHGGRRLLAAVATAFVLFLSVLTPLQARRWHDSETLFSHALALDPGNWLAELKLGELAVEEDDGAAALRHLGRAVELSPGNFHARTLYGVTLGRAGRPGEAAEQLAEAVRLAPRWRDARHNLGVTLANLGRDEEALPHLRAELRLAPGDPGPLRVLAPLLARTGRIEEASAACEAWLRLEPGNPAALALAERLHAAREGAE